MRRLSGCLTGQLTGAGCCSPVQRRLTPLHASKFRAGAYLRRAQFSTIVTNSVMPQVLVVTGPTAVGKTQLSLALAQQLRGEIISADSVQVYKGLDIGSDKVNVLDEKGQLHAPVNSLEACADRTIRAARCAPSSARRPACHSRLLCWRFLQSSNSCFAKYCAGLCLFPGSFVRW